MESWKEELYHYGIKGMKWKKRKAIADTKKTSQLTESEARIMEGHVRRYHEARQKVYDSKTPIWDMGSTDTRRSNVEYTHAKAHDYLDGYLKKKKKKISKRQDKLIRRNLRF